MGKFKEAKTWIGENVMSTPGFLRETTLITNLKKTSFLYKS
jgi:hypothetical protein